MTIHIDEKTTVRELVGRYPRTRGVFEQHGIDYCCGGGQSLAEAARRCGADVPSLAAALNEALAAPPGVRDPDERDWYAAPLGELVEHIVRVHHAYLKKALPRLRLLVRTVLNAHGERHGPMLRQVSDVFGALDAELSSHLLKEEHVLFPYIAAAEARAAGGAPKTSPPFGTVRNPIRQMEHEHQSAGDALDKLRQATGGYRLPSDACPTFAALYEELQAMEADLHQHIHLENNILFPRALDMEE